MIGGRMTHMAEARVEYNRPLGNATLRYGVDAIFAKAEDTELNLAGTGFEVENANNGLSARGFIGMNYNLSAGTAGFEIGMANEGRSTASGWMRFAF